MTVNKELIEKLKSLSKQEKLDIIKILFNIEPTISKKHSITELAGLGKEIWEGIDVEKYINEERNSWD